jgi:hypothetical protein
MITCEDRLTEVNAQQVVVQDYSRAYTTVLSLVRQTVIHGLDSQGIDDRTENTLITWCNDHDYLSAVA